MVSHSGEMVNRVRARSSRPKAKTCAIGAFRFGSS